MKIAILDDELHCIESLKLQIERLFPEFTIVFKSTKPYLAIEQLSLSDIDLLFLDIEMPGINGFQFLEQIPERNFAVIFTTAHSRYAMKAFKVKATNYLLKPIDETELVEAIEAYRREKKAGVRHIEQINELLQEIKNEGKLFSKISIPVSDGYEFLNVQDIIYCTSSINNTIFFLNGRDKLVASRTIKEVEQILSDYMFIRVHRSYLVNPNYIIKYGKRDGGYVLMQNQDMIPVSKNKRKELIRLFESF